MIPHHFKPSFGDAKVCRAYDGYIKCGQTRGAEIHVVTKQPAKPTEPQPSTSVGLNGDPVPEFVLVEFERWWSANHPQAPADKKKWGVQFATRYQTAKHAWITAYEHSEQRQIQGELTRKAELQRRYLAEGRGLFGEYPRRGPSV